MSDDSEHNQPQTESNASKRSPLLIIGLALAVLTIAVPVIVIIIGLLSVLLFAESSPVLPFIYTFL